MARREQQVGKRRAAAPRKGSPDDPGPLAVVILAAGQGKRMRSELPKVLQPLADRPLLIHVIDTARTLGPVSLHVVHGHGGDRVRAALAHEPVSWIEQAEQLGTGHALRQAAPLLADGERVLVLYGDVPLIRAATLERLLAEAPPNGIAILTVKLDDPSGYGRVIRDSRGGVRRIVEQRDATKRELAIRECSTGVLVAPAKRLRRWLGRLKNDNTQGEYYLTDVISMAVKERARVVPLVAESATEALGVNDKAQLAQVEAVYRRQRAADLMQAGVTVIDPARLDVRGSVEAGRDVTLDVNVVLQGRVSLGDRTRIGVGCVIRDSEIGADTEILPYSVIDGATLGEQCRIGPFARIRPTTALGREAHVGNFVEVKNSRMGPDSKANHLSYVGDAKVGSRVNIGAGTIIANYDGANKHRTTIEDDAHTGSNSVLVAPITVRAGATIAAGSTVTREVTAGKLTVARARQVVVEGWVRPRKRPKG